jgi:hypothetical protein
MLLRFLLCALLTFAVVGCESPYKKSDAEEKKNKKDLSKDPSFQAFIGRLRIAVNKRDAKMLSTMVAPNFGYRWDFPPPGENPMDYWERKQLWDELAAVLKKRFVPKDDYMVAPPAVVDDPDYAGYRAGMLMINGSWKFAYFVPAEPAE